MGDSNQRKEGNQETRYEGRPFQGCRRRRTHQGQSFIQAFRRCQEGLDCQVQASSEKAYRSCQEEGINQEEGPRQENYCHQEEEDCDWQSIHQESDPKEEDRPQEKDCHQEENHLEEVQEAVIVSFLWGIVSLYYLFLSLKNVVTVFPVRRLPYDSEG